MEKIVVITGGTSGLGEKLVQKYTDSGDKVFVLARSSDSSILNNYKCDVSSEQNVKECIDKIINKEGKIDILINNAGFGGSGITELMKIDEAKKIFDVDFWGTHYMIKYALPFMPNGSRIINISSAMALFPLPYRSFYASAKSAVSTYSFSLRMELKKLGIDVIAICPGDIKTNFTKNRNKNYDYNDRYGDDIVKITQKLDSREDKRMTVESCTEKIFKICQKKKTKPMYIIGGKYKFLYFISRIVPISLFHWGIKKFTT